MAFCEVDRRRPCIFEGCGWELGGISGLSRAETPVGAVKGKMEGDKERSRYLTFFLMRKAVGAVCRANL